MPQLPNQAPQISLNVPGANTPSPGEMGKAGTALGNLGATVMDSGLEALAQVKHAEAQDASAKAYFQDKLDSEDKLRQLKLQSDDGYMRDDGGEYVYNDDNSRRTITQEFHEWANQRYQDNQENMPSELASEMYRSRSLGYFSEQTGMLSNDVQVMKVKAWDQGLAERVQLRGDRLVTDPGMLLPNTKGGYDVDLSKFYSHTMDTAEEIWNQNGNIHNGTDGEAKIKDSYKNLSHDVMQGAYTQILAQKKDGDLGRVKAVQAWRDVLAGNDPDSMRRKEKGLPILAEMMDPLQKASEEEKLLHLLPTAKAGDLNDWKRQYNNYINNLAKGRGNDSTSMKMLSDINGFVSGGDMKAAEGVDRVSELVARQEYGKLQGPSFMNASPQTQAQMIASAAGRAKVTAEQYAKQVGLAYPEAMGATASNRIEDYLHAMAKRDSDMRKEDSAAYAQGTAPNGQPVLQSAQKMGAMVDFGNLVGLGKHADIIQQAMHDMKALHEVVNQGHPEYWRAVTKGQSQTMGQVLTDPHYSEEQTGNNFKGILRGFGPHAPGVIDQMINDQSLPETWKVIAQANPNVPQAVWTGMISAVRGSKSVDETFKNNVAGAGLNEKDLDTSVGKLTTAWAQAQEQANPYNTSTHNYQAAALSVVKNYAKQIYNQDPSQGFDTAAQKAYNQMIGQFSHIVPNGRAGKFWGQDNAGVAAIPKSYGSQVNTETDVANINTNMAHIMTEEGITGLNPDIPKDSKGQSVYGDKFIPMVSRTASFKTVTSPEYGFQIMYRSGNDGILQPLMRGGKPIVIPMDDAKKPPVHHGVIETMQKFLPSWLGGK